MKTAVTNNKLTNGMLIRKRVIYIFYAIEKLSKRAKHIELQRRQDHKRKSCS